MHPTCNGLPRTGAEFNNSAAGLDIRVAAASCIGPQFSISNPQQFSPLAKVTFEAHALGNTESSNSAAFNLFAALARTLAD